MVRSTNVVDGCAHSHAFDARPDRHSWGRGMPGLRERRGGAAARPCRHDRRPTGDPCSKEKSMIKVSVMYPNTPGARFDHDYYRDKHMPLVKARMGAACKTYTDRKSV